MQKTVDGKIELMDMALLELKNRMVELENFLVFSLGEEVDLDELLGDGKESVEEYMEHHSP